MELLNSLREWAEEEAKEKADDLADKQQKVIEKIADLQEHPSTFVEDAQYAGSHDGAEAGRVDFNSGHITDNPTPNAENNYEREFSFDSALHSEAGEKAPFVPDLTSPLNAFTSIMTYAPETNIGEATYEHGQNAYVGAYDQNYHQELSKEFDQKIEDRFPSESGWHAAESEPTPPPAAIDSPAGALYYSPAHDVESSNADTSAYVDNSSDYSNNNSYDSGNSSDNSPTYSSSSADSSNESTSSSSPDSSSGLY